LSIKKIAITKGDNTMFWKAEGYYYDFRKGTSEISAEQINNIAFSFDFGSVARSFNWKPAWRKERSPSDMDRTQVLSLSLLPSLFVCLPQFNLSTVELLAQIQKPLDLLIVVWISIWLHFFWSFPYAAPPFFVFKFLV
jgi:hypothetical protein